MPDTVAFEVMRHADTRILRHDQEVVDELNPTTIPIAALASPLAGVIATAFVSVFVAGSAAESKR